MRVSGIVGNGRAGLQDGADNELRLGRNGEQVMVQAAPDYWENLIRGQSFMASTGIAGVAPGTALSTTPPFVLYNPPNSGVIAAVCDAEIAYLSGTWGVGNIILAGIASQNISAFGTVLTPSGPNLVGAGTKPSCAALQAPTLSAAPTLMRNLWGTAAITAIGSATSAPADAKKDLKGLVGVMPGGAICIQMVGGAGTTPLGLFTMSWVELPLTFNK